MEEGEETGRKYMTASNFITSFLWDANALKILVNDLGTNC